MIRVLIGSVLAAIAMFVWGWLYWGVIGMVVMPYNSVPAESEAAIVEALKAGLPETGIYLYPMPEDLSDVEQQAAWNEKHLAGPLFEVNYLSEGRDPMAASMFGGGFAHMFLTALLISCVIGRAKSFGCRFGTVIALAVISAFWIDVGKIIWFYHPISFEVFNLIYHVSGLLIGGAILAGIVRPATPKES